MVPSLTDLLVDAVDTLRCDQPGCLSFPPGNNTTCTGCLDSLRLRDSEARYRNYADYLNELNN